MLGIDVGVRTLHVVAVRGHRVSQAEALDLQPGHVRTLLRELRPDAVGVDSPPAWALSGGSRQAERDLAAAGLSAYATPTADRAAGNEFYDWMRAGMKVFAEAADVGYLVGDRRTSARGRALEVFPHAVAVALVGHQRPSDVTKTVWRRGVVKAHLERSDQLTNADLVDAALAALGTLAALDGDVWLAGDPDEGVVWVPGPRPDGRYPDA